MALAKQTLAPLERVPVQNPALQRLLDNVVIQLKTWRGELGSASKLVSVNDFLSDTDVANTVNGNNDSGGINTGSTVDTTIPSNLSNLLVTEADAVVILTWDGANIGNYAHTEIYRSSVDDPGTATVIGTSIAPIFSDDIISIGVNYYYWVKPISTSNIAGGFNQTAGTVATTQGISAASITVPNLAAINANLGAITAGSLSINNKFLVDDQGNVTIRNNTTGARVEIYNNVIKVYDASNVKRVQIGDLSVA